MELAKGNLIDENRLNHWRKNIKISEFVNSKMV